MHKTDIEEILSGSPLIIRHEIERVSLSRSLSYLKGEALFLDDSRLFFFELRRARKTEKYRYQYQDKDGTGVFRYDNAPHPKKVKSFPHHKHVGEDVMACEPADFLSVLKEIETLIIGRIKGSL